jgi:peptide/nickel transport system substrate-binding protein
MYHWDSPPSMSIHEEVTISTDVPMMGVFNNLVLFDQHVVRNSLQSIVPDFATSWSWSEDGTQLMFRLRHGVRWHDGQPFTARDVECTWNLGRTAEKLRTNPRKSWYQNVESVSADGDDVATFHLKRPQPALLALARLGIVAGLSLPRAAARDAHPSNRHGSLQIRRVQAR